MDIYTDGGCLGHPGPGAWAAVIYLGSKPTKISGFENVTTNQWMELRAAIEALKLLEHPREVRLYSDSAYVFNGMNQRWYVKWQQNGWKSSKKKPVENRDLWEELVRLSKHHAVEWRKVKGHAGIGSDFWNC